MQSDSKLLFLSFNYIAMKKTFAILFLLFSLSCDDGNIDISSFEFEETVNVCGEYVLYRLSTDGHREFLMVTLTDDQIKNSIDPVLPVSVTQTGLYTVTDRVFDSEVTKSYFCTVVPPSEPKVTKDWRGTSGNILVKNEPVYDTDGVTIKAYNHIIVLNNVVLVSGDESLIFGDTYLFGTFTTNL